MREATYKNYLLGLLLVILAANYVDRLVLGMVLQDIKTDLALTDTELGFLSGLAFTVFFAVIGIPLGQLGQSCHADLLISLTAGLWSV